ncbi:MAG: phospholipase, partial [Rubrivivax sp.]
DRVIPGWLDKAWKRRHRATAALANLVLLSPSPEWVRSLPGGKLPDRSDFKAYLHDEAGRQRAWRQALSQSQQLADELAAIVQTGRPIDALSLP